MDKAQIYLGFIAVLVIVGAFFVFSPDNTKADSINLAGAPIVEAKEYQKVELSFQNGNYYPQIITVKQNLPVRIIVDTDTVRGCMANVVIPDLGVEKTVSPGDNLIDFMPKEKGRFKFMCGMGMGTGTLVVE